MESRQNPPSISNDLQQDLETLTTTVQNLANQCQGDTLLLLALLRTLEKLHREIRDGVFQSSLPDNRQNLYNLLKNMESEGGWPYIQRMKLRTLLECLILPQEDTPES